MGNCDLSWFFRMFELVVIPLGVMENPAILFQSFYDFPTLHDVYYTH